MDADVVVSSTLLLGQMGDRLACHVMLRGLTVVRPSCILGNCKACLTLKAAVKTRRLLFLSDGFRTKYAHLVNIIVGAMAAHRPASLWRIFDTFEQYTKSYISSTVRSKHQFVILAKRHEDIPGMTPSLARRRFDKERFMGMIEHVDRDRTRGS